MHMLPWGQLSDRGTGPPVLFLQLPGSLLSVDILYRVIYVGSHSSSGAPRGR